MDSDAAGTYLEAIEVLKSREALRLLKIQDWSSMTAEARTSYWEETKKRAFPKLEGDRKRLEEKPVSNADLAAWLRGTLGG